MIKNLLLIISGGIAAYRILDLLRKLDKNNINIDIILTKSGRKFVTDISLEALTSRKIYLDEDFTDNHKMSHIELSRRNDLILVAPATADIMAKLACGLADDLASSVLLAANKKIIMAPAMNPQMWNNKAVQRNIKILQSDGVEFIGPAEGSTACMEAGIGKLENIDIIYNKIIAQ